MASSPPWAHLPDDILKTVAAYLLPNVFDVLSFEAVCKSWRAALLPLRLKEEVTEQPRGPPLPCLTFRRIPGEPAATGGGEGEDEAAAPLTTAVTPTDTTRCFYSLANESVYSREVPDESPDWVCEGSSHGWLLMTDRYGGVFLFNPITSARVDLPSVTTLPGVLRVGRRKRDGAALYILLDPPHRDDPAMRKRPRFYRTTVDDLRRLLLKKLALSSSPLDPDCIAVVIQGGFYILAYARPGDRSWTELKNPWHLFKDVIYHNHEDRFYALSTVSDSIVSIEFPSSGHQDGRLLEPIVKVVAPKAKDRFCLPSMEYLVSLPSGEILQVLRYKAFVDDSEDDEDEEGSEQGDTEDDVIGDDEDDSGSEYENVNEDREFSDTDEFECDQDEGDDVVSRTASFKVFMLVNPGKNKKKCWKQLVSIGKYSLFLGINQSISLSASDEVTGKYKPGGIYFTGVQKSYGGHDCGVFQIGKQTLEFLFPTDMPQIMPPLTWIIPDR